MLRIDTSFSWSAYRALLLDHLDAELQTAADPASAPPRGLMRVLLNLQVLSWLHKRFRLGGRLRFELDDQGLRRHSRMGIKHIAWTEVLDARRLPSGWLFRLPEGRMGICAAGLTSDVRRQLEAQVPPALWESP
jgi:hypothetical protein